MKKIPLSKVKDAVKSLTNLPTFLFIFIAVISIVSFTGRRGIISKFGLFEGSNSGEVLGASTPKPRIEECVFGHEGLRACEDPEVSTRTIPIPLTYRGNDPLEGSTLPNPLWNVSALTTSKIKDIDIMKYLSQIEYEGLGADSDYDFINQAGQLNRLETGLIPDYKDGGYLWYDLRSAVDERGYAHFVDDEGNIVGRPQYNDGAGIIFGRIGTPTDFWNKDNRYARQILSEEAPPKNYEAEVEIESIHFTDGKPSYTVSKQCVGDFEEIDGVLTDEYEPESGIGPTSTSGNETVVETLDYEWDLENIIMNSNLATTIGKECNRDSSGSCIIQPSLARCNPCYEPGPPQPGNTSTNSTQLADMLRISGHQVDGDHPMILVFLSYRDLVDEARFVTYGSANLTRKAYVRRNEYTSEIWYLADPRNAGGNEITSGDVLIGWTDTVEDIYAVAFTVTAVDIEEPLGQFPQTLTAWSNNPHIFVTSTDKQLVFGGVTSYNGETFAGVKNSITTLSPTIQLWNENLVTTNLATAGGYMPGNSANIMKWDMATSWPWAAAAVIINPFNSTEQKICEHIYYDESTDPPVIKGETDSEKTEHINELTECINDTNNLHINYQFQSFVHDFQLGGGLKLLRTYLGYLKSMTTKPICTNKNIGGKVVLEQKIRYPSASCTAFADYLDEIKSEIESIDCDADPKFETDDLKDLGCTLNTVADEYDNYLPYLANTIWISRYMATTPQAIREEVEDLPDCSSAEDGDIFCFCDEGQDDPLGIYLYRKGALTNDLEAKILTGYTLAELDSKYEQDIDPFIPEEGTDHGGDDDGGDDDDDDDYDYGDGDDDITIYNGTCQQIFDQVKNSDPFSRGVFSASMAPIRLRMQDLGSGYFCDALTSPYVSCSNQTVGDYCDNCPIRANAIFRHELNHWSHLGGGPILSEFFAEATSMNGGWYRFKRAGSNQWLWATQIRDWIIDTQDLPRDVFMAYLYGDPNAKRELQQIKGVADFDSFMSELVVDVDRWSTGDPVPPGLELSNCQGTFDE